ncbi:hypothetical protein Hanom_Chr05g00474101 [Helianthus anomalus]
MALAPSPWSRRRSGRVGLRALGTQQWMMVPSPRSVVVDRRPEVEKVDRRHQFREATRLKHFGMCDWLKS